MLNILSASTKWHRKTDKTFLSGIYLGCLTHKFRKHGKELKLSSYIYVGVYISRNKMGMVGGGYPENICALVSLIQL